MTDITKKAKSRIQTTYEYFETLQLEWIVCELRTRIYLKQKDKEFWSKVKTGKKVTIETIAEKYILPTIFTDEDLKAEFQRRIFVAGTHPIFIYKNAEDELQQKHWDLFYYYSPNEDCRIDLFGDIKVGKVKDFKPHLGNKITLVLNNTKEEIQTTIDRVQRIL